MAQRTRNPTSAAALSRLVSVRSDRPAFTPAYLTLLVGMVAFGGTWPAGKLAADHIAPATIATARFAGAAALLWLWARISGRPVRRPQLADLRLVAVLGFTVVFAYNLFFLYGLRHAPAADGSVLVPGLIPIVTTLLVWRFFGERPSQLAAVGLAVALAGLVVVADPVGRIASSRLVGDALYVGAACAWAAYTVAGREATVRFGSVSANVYATAAGSLMLLPLSFLDGGWSAAARAPASAWAGVAYLSVIGTVLGFVLFFEGVRLIGAARASAFALLVPIFGVISSVLIVGDHLHPALAIGGPIVLAGLCITESARSRAARATIRS